MTAYTITAHEEKLAIAAHGAAHWLHLAAAPTFAVMAVLAGVFGGPQDMLCASTHHAPALGGMTSMYVLMSVFHSAAWLRFISAAHGPHNK